MAQAMAAQRPQPAIGALRETALQPDRPEELRHRFAEDGYVFLRGVLDQQAVARARREVLDRLAAIDEIVEPPEDAIATGRSRRAELQPDLGAFWKSVSEGGALRAVTHGAELRRAAGLLFDADAIGHDYMFLRVAPPGRASLLHYDFPFMNQGTPRVATAWMPLGEVPVSLGPLAVVEGSNHFDDLVEPIRARTPRSAISLEEDPIEFARSRGTRLLSADFAPGDVILFGMFTMHCSLQNTTERQVRVSCDVRYQPAQDARDPRYFGANPAGFGGGGYGEVNCAKPLTAEWHTR